MRKAIVLFSGGQDSTTCLFWALREYGSPDNVMALSINYGQRHARELEAARKIASYAGVTHEILELPAHTMIGSSPLTRSGGALETYGSFAEMAMQIGNRIEHTFIPMRNMLFMVIAANRAAAGGAQDIVSGVCQADTANYPDCRNIYVGTTELAIGYALGCDREDGPPKLNIVTPLMDLDKSKTCRLALELPGCWMALSMSHTAYDGKYPPIGQDHASLLRAEGFHRAGVPDPLVVRAWAEGLMPLPASENYDFVLDGLGRNRIDTQTPDWHVARVGQIVGAAHL